jgi:hypothetical protein
MNLKPVNNSINIFRVTKRRDPWEPFFIETNSEPLFGEELTWEGKKDKMTQVFHLDQRFSNLISGLVIGL